MFQKKKMVIFTRKKKSIFVKIKQKIDEWLKF